MKLKRNLVIAITLLALLTSSVESVLAIPSKKPAKISTSYLYWAVLKDNPMLVELLLQKGADPNAHTSEAHGTLLSICLNTYRVHHNDENPFGVITLLLKYGADPNIKSNGNPAILSAIWTNEIALVEIMLTAGASVHESTRFGYTILELSAMAPNSPNKDAVIAMLRGVADAENKLLELQKATTKKVPPLSKLASLVIARTCEKIDNGNTPHQLRDELAAAKNPLLFAARIYLEKYPNPDEDSTDEQKYLRIAANAIVNRHRLAERSRERQTEHDAAAIAAAAGGIGGKTAPAAVTKSRSTLSAASPAAADFLTHPRHANDGDGGGGGGGKHDVPATTSTPRATTTTSRYSEAGSADEHAKQALFRAVTAGNTDETSRNDALAVNARDNDGDTPLLLAVLANNIGAAKQLLAHGVDINATDKYGDTPLIAAIRDSKDEMTLFLLACKDVLVNTQNNDGETALMWAVRTRNYRMLDMLLEHNAALDIKNNRGETAVDIARDDLNDEMEKILVRAEYRKKCAGAAERRRDAQSQEDAATKAATPTGGAAATAADAGAYRKKYHAAAVEERRRRNADAAERRRDAQRQKML